MKYLVKYSLLILFITIISACKTQEIYKVNRNGDVTVDLTVVADTVHSKKSEKLGSLLLLESSLDEVISELSKARWNVEIKWISKRAPYKLRMKLKGNINKVKNTTKYYKFTNIGGNVIKFILNVNNGNNIFDISAIDRTYTFKSSIFGGVEYYDVNGNKLKKSAGYNRMDAVYVFLEKDNRTLNEIKNRALVRSKAKAIANNTITDYIDKYFPTCNGSRYMISPEAYPQKQLTEIKDSSVVTEGLYLNKADELNGTVWKGSISLVGDVSRELQDLEKGWGEWKADKVTYVRLDVQIKDKGDETVIYNIKNNYWNDEQKDQKWSLVKLDCAGVDNIAGTPALNKIGMKYLNKRDYKKSLTWFRKSMEEGNSFAEYNIGYLYENGFGVKKSAKKALLMYKKSATKGNTIAQNHLGNIYSQGIGVNESVSEAYYWYKKSAEQGNALAQGRLGFFYLNGLGVQKSEETAFFWYKKSAEQGNALAQSFLAKSYKNGMGTAKDEKRASIWYARATAQGFKNAGQKYFGVNKKLTVTNKKLVANNIKTIKANKALEKTNIKLTKDNIKTTRKNKLLVNVNSKLTKANKKLAKENKRLAKLNKKLAKASKVRVKSVKKAKKASQKPVKEKQPVVASKKNKQSNTKTGNVTQQHKVTTKTQAIKITTPTDDKPTTKNSTASADKPKPATVNKTPGRVAEKSAAGDTSAEKITAQPEVMKVNENVSE